MRLGHIRVASAKAARAGFTVIEVLLALSLTLVIIGGIFGGVVAYSRANTAANALEGLNVTAKVLEDQLRRDLTLISRTRTFVDGGNCPVRGVRPYSGLPDVGINPPPGPGDPGLGVQLPPQPSAPDLPFAPGVQLVLLHPKDGSVTRVDYLVSSPGVVSRKVEGLVTRTFNNVYGFYIGCLENGQVTATATVREQVLGAAENVGQQVEVRVTSAVRMR